MHVIGNPVREHRTALVVDVSKPAKSDFTERVNRLRQSLNGPNIKVDVYTFDGVTLRQGWPDEASGGTPPSAADFESFAAGLGYTQLLVDSPV